MRQFKRMGRKMPRAASALGASLGLQIAGFQGFSDSFPDPFISSVPKCLRVSL